jgi:ABC-type multidrug transport system fused ATPase/permease subunit
MTARANTLHSKSLLADCRASAADAGAGVGEEATRARGRTLFSFYVRALREVFRPPQRPGGALVFLVASAVHSFGHAALALAAGRCAVLLVGSFGRDSVSESLSAKGIRAALILSSIGLLAAVAKLCGGVVAAHGQAKIAARVGGMLRLEILDDWFASYQLRRPRQDDHGLCLPPPGSEEASAPRVPLRTAARGVSALTGRVSEIETGLSQGLLGGGRAVAQLLPLAAALVWLSPKLALAAFSVLVPFSIILSSSRRAWRRVHAAATRDSEELLEAADEAVRHADLWVSYSAEPKARAAVAHLGETLGQRAARIQAGSAAMSGGNEVLAALALLGALGAAAAGWLGSVGTGGQMLGFTVCFFLMYRPIRDLAEARLAWSRASMAFADLSDLRAADTGQTTVPREVEERPAPTTATTSPKVWDLEELHLDGLVLRHGTTAPVSFVLAPGEVVVVVGATGEGKTTLVRTLLGLEAAGGGEARYGQTSLSSAPPGTEHRPFAWVPQDSALLTDTLEANVKLGISSEPVDVRGVLRVMGAVALADATEGRRLGPGGVAVSGGERQWIAMARALATSQPVLLLDEPTSGLDPLSQARVLDAIASLRGTRSVLFVTHRPEPLALADVVVRFDRGEVVVEDGPMRHSARSP